MRWDHLLYTGSPAIGREIAKAAAEQLVPVTLELGGKCPAILTEDSIDAESVKQVLGTKALKNGQMCISVDYCLVPRERIEDFARAGRRRTSARRWPSSPPRRATPESSPSATSSGSSGCSRTPAAHGGDVRPLGGAGDVDPERRQLPLSLVVDPADELELMQEEIFGPILPVKAYDALDDAIDHVNAGERPLALYVFSKDERGGRPGAAADDLGRRLRQHRRRPRRPRRRCPSAASGRAAPAATTGSRASASSRTRAASSSAAKAT